MPPFTRRSSTTSKVACFWPRRKPMRQKRHLRRPYRRTRISCRLTMPWPESTFPAIQQQKAIDQYTAILEKDPNQAGPHMLLGTIYDMQKQFDMSEKHYRAALDINPQFAPAANNLAYLLSSREGDIDEALKFAQVAKEKLPDDPSVMDTLGWIYYKKGSMEMPSRSFRTAWKNCLKTQRCITTWERRCLKKATRRVPNYPWKRHWRWTIISTAPRMRNGCCRRYSR
jgi:tetratricopeptide (TPR) repeat protein